MWFLVILLSIPLLYSWYLFANRRKFELAAKFPGPKTYPLVGNLPMYLNKKPEDVLDLLEYNFANFGRFYRVWIGSFQVAFFMCDPKDVEVLLSSNKVLTKFSLYNHLIPWLGTGLLIADGKKWHTRRKIITPTFHFKILEQFLETFNRQGAKMVQLMKESVSTEGTVVDFYPFINSCTLDIICETAMGIEFNSMDKKNSEYVKAVVRVSEIAALRFVKAWMRPNLIFSLFYSELKKEFHDRIKVMHDFTNRIINKRRDQLISEGGGLKKTSEDDVNSQADEVDMGIKKKMALLDVLLQSTVDGKGLSNEDIREEVDTFMFEGHDTTTCALSFAMYAISKNPEVQKKIYAELKDLFSGRDPTEMVYSDLGELKYLELVIKETLRMYPPVPMYGRYTEEEININGRIIPSGCNIGVIPYLMGRDPEIFPEPEKFNPERFTKENMQDKNPFSFVVFSAGPRNCIGQKFAMIEMKSILAKLLYTFELYSSGIEPILSTELVLRSKNGIHIGMKLRSKT